MKLKRIKPEDSYNLYKLRKNIRGHTFLGFYQKEHNHFISMRQALFPLSRMVTDILEHQMMFKNYKWLLENNPISNKQF